MLAVAAWPARAIIFAVTDDVTHNTTAPTATLTNSGWQYEGQWGAFLGTPIAPTFFLAAQHVGGSPGDVFTLNGFSYHTVAYSNSPDSDLRVWQVAETFPYYAPLFTQTNEVGKHCVVFGRGKQRGAEVVVNGQTNGWQVGPADAVERWGENEVNTIENLPTYGETLRCTFDRLAPTTNECHLAEGDSSGGVFVQDGTIWKLVGVNLAVDGRFSTDGTTNTQFDAALLDMRGLYIGEFTNWEFISTNLPPQPSAFYSTRISSHLGWINSVIHFQPGADLGITAVTRTNSDLQITFVTGTNRLYRLDFSTDLAANVWTNLTNNIVGTGSPMTVTDFGVANSSPRFYSIRLNP